VEAATGRGLADPIGTGRLSGRVDADTKIALVIDDDSRPTPVSAIVPALFKELQAGGARLENVTVIPGLGVHRAMTEAEMAARVGEEWFAQINWTMHDCDDKEKLSYLGETSRGTPVWVNKTVAESDLIISVGCIEPHIIASFGGGYKNLIPGVAARETIAHNHGLNTTPDTFNNVGQPIDKNPMRLDLEEGAQMLKPPVFIINAVLNSALQPVEIVCGDPIEAHRAGTKTSAQVYGVQMPLMADVLITASYPMDQDLRQGVKALANNVRAVRKGGVMITAIRADEGVGVFGLANRKLPVGRGVLRLLAPLLLPNIGRLPLSGMGEEDRFFLYFALQAMRHADLLVYAPNIPEEIHECLPFVTFVSSMEEAIAQARKKFSRQADVVVIPNGGSSYPILPH
jgi:nickel-dependent lactate racemase